MIPFELHLLFQSWSLHYFIEFCGGFNSSSSTRSLFPLNSAPILIDSHHNSADVGIQISFNSNPTSFNQFNQTTNGTGYGNLMSFGTINGQGEVSL